MLICSVEGIKHLLLHAKKWNFVYLTKMVWINHFDSMDKFSKRQTDDILFFPEKKKQKKNYLQQQKLNIHVLTLLLLNMTCPVFANSVDSDQLASEEAN